jgi:hypothetical protein
VGGVVAALCAAVGASGVLAIGVLAPAAQSVRPVEHLASAASPGADARVAAEPSPTAAPAPAPAPTPAAGAQPAESLVTQTSALPVAGEATESGCGAALEYLNAYAAPGFAFECPGNAQGHQAMTTCVSGTSACSILRLIVIADPCPNAYMNEASNSWALIGASDAPLDPYGYCA